MRNGVIFSALLHICVILILLVGLPELFRRDLEPPPIIPIEIINISDVTQAPALKVKEKVDGPKDEPKEKPEPPKPTPVEEKQPEPEPEKKLEPEPEPRPEPELTMDDLLAPVEDEKPKEEKPKEKPQEKPKEKKKEKKKEKPKKKKKNAMSKLITTIEEAESSAEGKTQPEQDSDSMSDTAADRIGALSGTEINQLKKQLSDAWIPPVWLKDGKELKGRLRIYMNPDGSVRDVVVIESELSKPKHHHSMRALIESARRAVLKAGPFKLSPESYHDGDGGWKTINAGFDQSGISL